MQRDLFIEQNARIKVVRVRIANLTLILLLLNLLIWLYATVPAIEPIKQFLQLSFKESLVPGSSI